MGYVLCSVISKNVGETGSVGLGECRIGGVLVIKTTFDVPPACISDKITWGVI